MELRLPALYHLRADAFERASHESIGYARGGDRPRLSARSSAAYVANWLASFKEFPPRQKPASFSLDQVMQKLTETADSAQ